MTKIHPHIQAKQEDHSNRSEMQEMNSILMPEQANDQQLHVNAFQKRKLDGCISLRVFVIIAFISLILVCSISVYMSVFIGLYTSNDELLSKVINNVEDKIIIFITQLLEKLRLASNVGADVYNYGLIDKPQMRDYIFRQYNNSAIQTGYFFATPSERYSVIEVLGSLFYTYQPPKFPGIIRDKVSGDGTVLAYNYTVDTTPAQVIQQGFYNSTIKAANLAKTKGAFGSIYYIINGSLALPYGSMLYDPVKFKQSPQQPGPVQGLCRCAVPLYLLSNFLSQIQVFQRGYVLLTEYNSTVTIAGSINTTTADLKNTLSIFDLTDRNAGALMKQIYSQYPNTDQLPEKVRMSSMGVSYVVKTRKFQMDNLNWKLYIVVYEEDVTLTTTISVVVSVCAVFIITLLSVGFGLFLSHIITTPISFLKQQFELIKVMDLEKVKFTHSIFSEISQIYNNLENTVEWLKEIKSFVPENVFLQLQSLNSSSSDSPREDSPLTEKKQDHDHNHSSSAHRISMGSSSDAKHSSKMSDDLAKGVFKMGLTQKECSLIYITLPDYLLQYSQDDISHTFPKIITAISSISKIYQGNLQIITNAEFKIVLESKKRHGKRVSLLAQECALKIAKGLEIANSSILQQKIQPIVFCIGVSTSSSFVGNLGSNSLRFFSCISQVCEIAKQLCFMANHLKVSILMDENTQKEGEQSFVTRPVDRMLLEKYIHHAAHSNQIPIITNVYHLVKENKVENDEWLYELQVCYYSTVGSRCTIKSRFLVTMMKAQNENNNYKDFHTMFEIFKSHATTPAVFENIWSNSVVQLERFIEKNPNDVVSQYLKNLFNRLTTQDKAEKYYSKVDQSVVQVLE
ncbi:hypothetical protein C9374_012592 [Naegleria lovaniensis]|uniref:Guanylate cyclase domain-containing protein n=1 Tax=Naegleria lovaniensis TaxID=51637 RepID=A0AA88H008_NAELO|nr:uncharacterized protein C9374_012592 [Naegleria lovaniensis]KAG2392340.1 hypothetical protein C9374_012592 [Naegleria lovaniensis]